MAYKFDLMRGKSIPATPHAAYGLQGLKPPIPYEKFEPSRIIWSQGPDNTKLKNLLQARAMLEKSDALCHLKGHIDRIVYRPTVLFVGGALTLAGYKLFRLAFKM